VEFVSLFLGENMFFGEIFTSMSFVFAHWSLAFIFMMVRALDTAKYPKGFGDCKFYVDL